MVDVLLVSPFDEESIVGTVVTGPPFLGLCILASSLKAWGFSVAIEDNVKPSHVQDMLDKHKPAVVGITVSSPLSHQAKKIVSKIKESDGKCKVILGGPHITAMPDTLKYIEADFGLSGECEKTLPQLCKKILEGEVKNLGDVSGLYAPSMKKRRGIPRTADLDALPQPDFTLVDLKKYGAIAIEASRGCPFACIYCARSARSKVRFKSPEKIVDELQTHMNLYGAGSFSFVDDVFTLERERVFEFCEELCARGIRVAWSCTTRVDCVDEELLRYMKKSGLNYISFGVETGVERIRAVLGKGIPNRTYEDVFSLCGRLKIPSSAHIMFGHPGETFSDMCESVSFVRRLKPTYAVFRNTLILPGSRLFEMAVLSGVVSDDCWVKFVQGEGSLPYYAPKGVLLREIEDLRRKAISSFYLSYSYLKQRFLTPNSIGEVLGFPYFLYLVGRFSPDFP